MTRMNQLVLASQLNVLYVLHMHWSVNSMGLKHGKHPYQGLALMLTPFFPPSAFDPGQILFCPKLRMWGMPIMRPNLPSFDYPTPKLGSKYPVISIGCISNVMYCSLFKESFIDTSSKDTQ